jgi:uracil-DNA glycosylase family 4
MMYAPHDASTGQGAPHKGLLVFPSHPECQLCDRHTRVGPGGHVGVPTVSLGLPPSPDTPAVVLIGMNPGYYESQKNEPFVGKSGQLMRKCYLGCISLETRASIYLTNAARCGPEADVKQREFNACFPYTIEDLRLVFETHTEVEPAVVLLGADAVRQFHRHVLDRRSNLRQAFNRNGARHFFERRSFVMFSTYHPAFLLRNYAMSHAVADHLALLDDHLRGILREPTQPHIVPPRPPVKDT